MVREIMHDETFLSEASAKATVMDLYLAQDLRDTLAAHADACVGMAANMIGIRKNVIIFDDEGTYRVMFNPEIVHSSGEYETEEGCLSLPGERHTKRFRRITVKFRDESFTEKTEKFRDFTAQIIQHEIDHTNGVLI